MATAEKRAAATSVQPLLTRKQVASTLQVTTHHLSSMISGGRFPKPDLMVGLRCPRWKPETLTTWINQKGA